MLGAGLLIHLACNNGHANAQRLIDRSTLTGKFVLGYQGWFSCPGDHGQAGWGHWFYGSSPGVEMLPDVSELPPEDRCQTPLHARSGKAVELFSNENPRTVDRHFGWMQQYDLDGVALQRFVTHLRSTASRQALNTVVANVRSAAEAHGRLFFIMYDLSGATAEDLANVVDDWRNLEAQRLTASPAYSRHRGHAVLGLWGLGFAHRAMTPGDAAKLLSGLTAVSTQFGGVTFLGGVPTYWRTGDRDASPDMGWHAIWDRLGILSPWTVARYGTVEAVDRFAATTLSQDLAETKRLGVDYMPVVFPGASGGHDARARGDLSPASGNEIPRRCGQFLWRQAYDFLSQGATMVYGAMFDEVDEGTAFFKLVESANNAPEKPWFLTLDADGCRLPSDWYLKLGQRLASALHRGERIQGDMPLPPR